MQSLITQLTYTNTANQHLLKRHYQNHWFRSKNRVAWEARLDELKKSIKNTLLFSDGGQFIRPGSLPYLEGLTLEVASTVTYPEPKKVPWKHLLPFELHPYQEESWEKLLAIKHGNVELCTGSGKSAILLKLCRETGFNSAIIAPSRSIFNELLEKFEHHFGKGMVGRFGDGKKVLGKKFTICIGDSIANVKPGMPEWEFFSKLQMICVDESHTWGAETLEKICHGVLSAVPYRLFFSGTQTRGDGAEKLLQSIIGKTVHTLTTAEAVAKGYICPHEFGIVSLESSDPSFASNDALEMKRVHFLGNKNIAAFSAKLANAQAAALGRQTLILVEELDQIRMILPLLKCRVAIAHAEKNAARLAEIGLHKVDPAESVEAFNKHEVDALVGTSCISTGTNIYPTHHTINWQGGTSEIKTKQGAVGRSVRLHNQNPWKDKCVQKDKATIWDFNIYDCEQQGAHLEKRIEYYSDSGSEIKYIRIPRI